MLPDLPLDSPDMVQPLLEQISTDLGLDNLTLLDLRDLDPPPALGANLIMIIGTARSEKHLHVSADRLCRWLRSKYNLTPVADGLLGRNELKLKLRRKARRAKIMKSAGAIENSNVDDGIRTGWVCVNVGTVKPKLNQQGEANPMSDFVGFGARVDGVKIVVQMLTEEKRQELRLEHLWGEQLERQSKRDMQLQKETQGEHSSQDRVGSEVLESRESHSSPSGEFNTASTNVAPSQRRSFHTSARQFTGSTSNQMLSAYLTLPSTSPAFEKSTSVSPWIDSRFLEKMHSGDYNFVRGHLVRLASFVDELSDGKWKVYLLKTFRNYLESLPVSEALKVLGTGSQDFSSTPFLFQFYQTMPTFPNALEWEHRISLYCYAVKLGHSGWSKAGLLDLLMNMQASAVDIPERIYHDVLTTLLSVPILNASSQDAASQTLNQADIELAVKVLEQMNYRGFNVLSEDILVLLHEAIGSLGTSTGPLVPITFAESELGYGRRTEVIALQSRLNDLATTFCIPILTEKNCLRLLCVFSAHQNWKCFWDIWRSMPYNLRPRSSALYAFMFRTVANTKNIKQAIDALRMWVPEMEREEPAINMSGDVAKAVMHCIDVAVSDDQNGEHPSREWGMLREKCKASLDHRE
jgi:hypothetical protein